ncbi:HAD family hydrolase [uncultured Amaricoccus sp.]|uniref:HAD family hydrolase n=1 Tax=uncultured Amaricoccus sp. TaxID=339341 RepID=UPI0026354139|nr:HAD family hydrolase [uncultured Amaricoccus sp.]
MFLRATLAAALLAVPALAQDDPLPSWNDGPTKQAIVAFVQAATAEGGPGFIAPDDRIATFDNDGTLWSEQPMYFQGMFVNDRIRAMAADHPEWADEMPYKAVLDGDLAALGAAGEQGLVELVAATHAGMTNEEFEALVKDWIATARHPRFDRPYTDLVFQPMLEVLDYLRDNGFETWIVSGGGIDFMRPWAEQVYGIPPQQVVGSQIAVTYNDQDGPPRFDREPGVFFVDDKAGKPVGILRHIGKRPVIAFGNSDGDFEMLDYVTAGDGPDLGLIVHHTDAAREWAYDRDSHVGQLARALDAAPDEGWLLIDMASDWKVIYPFEKQ